MFSTLSSPQDIPPGTPIAIFGTGDTARKFYHYWTATNPASPVAFFLDSFRPGELFGLEVKLASQVEEVELPVIICSVFWNQILPRTGILRPYLLSNELLHNTTHLVNWGSFHIEEEKSKTLERSYQKIRERMETDKDKEHFDLLWQMRTRSAPESEIFNRLLAYHKPNSEQYLDRISERRVETIIEAGVFDGFSTLSFFKRFGQGISVYGFDPYPQQYRNSRHREELEDLGFSFHDEALWESSGETALDPQNPNERVKTVSVDDFIQARGIKADLLKMDVEGHEMEILKGARRAISEQKPTLALSIYHRAEDLVKLPQFILNVYPEYKFRLGSYTPTFVDTVLYAL